MNKFSLSVLSVLLVIGSIFLSVISTQSPICSMNANDKPSIETHNNSCINIQLAARLKIGHNYVLLQNGSVDNSLADQCGKEMQRIKINYTCADLVLNFKLNTTDGERSLVNIEVLYHNATNQSTPYHLEGKVLEFPQATNYRCNTEQTFNVTTKGATNQTTASLYLSNLKIDAFNERTNNLFNLSSDHVCNLDPSDWVRIAVFLCLVGLVLIVLVAYFVGRRRWSERSSYESV